MKPITIKNTRSFFIMYMINLFVMTIAVFLVEITTGIHLSYFEFATLLLLMFLIVLKYYTIVGYFEK